MTCSNTLPNLSACMATDADNRKFIENLLKTANDKFLNFLFAENVDIFSIAIYTTRYKPRGFSDKYDWANCKIEYRAFNMDGYYYLKLTRKQLKQLYDK